MPECVNEMVPLERDLSVFGKLELAKPPVGVKFLFGQPEGSRGWIRSSDSARW